MNVFNRYSNQLGLTPRWAGEEITREEWDEMATLPLLYLHNVLRGLEVRIVAAIDGNTDESYSVLELRQFAYKAEHDYERGARRWVHNYERLLDIVILKEREEIAALTGRAA